MHNGEQFIPFLQHEHLILMHDPWEPHFTRAMTACGAGSSGIEQVQNSLPFHASHYVKEEETRFWHFCVPRSLWLYNLLFASREKVAFVGFELLVAFEFFTF